MISHHNITYLSHPPTPTKKTQQNQIHPNTICFKDPILPILPSSPPNSPQGIPNDPTSTTFNLKVSPGESGTLRVQQQTLEGWAPPCCFKTHGGGRSDGMFLLVIEFVGVLLLKLFLGVVSSHFLEQNDSAHQHLPLLLCSYQLMPGAMWFLNTFYAKLPLEWCPLAMINQFWRLCSFQSGNSLCVDASTVAPN